jgi:hypothetical protein
VRVDLWEFLKTGRFGLLHLGLSRSQVEQILNHPEAESFRTGKSQILKYGPLELVFHADQLVGINVYFRATITGLSPPQVHMGGLTHESSLEAVMQQLETRGIPAAVDTGLTFDSQVCLCTPHGARIIFVGTPSKLDSIQYGEG